MPNIGTILQFTMHGIDSGSSPAGNLINKNSFIYQCNNTGTLAAQAPLFIAAFQFTVEALITLRVAGNVSWMNHTVVFPQFPGLGVFSGGAVFNSAGGGQLPSNQCFVVRLETGLRGRSFLGHKKISPVTKADTIGDELTPARWASYTFLLQGLKTTLVSGAFSWTPVVWSRKLSTFVAGVPTTCIGAPITAISVNKTLGQIRHRREDSVYV